MGLIDMTKDVLGKVRLDLITSYEFLEEIVKVRENGVSKYKDPENWRSVENIEWLRAASRHVNKALLNKEHLDPESNLMHASHAATSLMFYITNILLNPEKVSDNTDSKLIYLFSDDISIIKMHVLKSSNKERERLLNYYEDLNNRFSNKNYGEMVKFIRTVLIGG